MNFTHIVPKIAEELTKPLPGRPVQLIMSSIQRLRELFDFAVDRAKESSVLILLYPEMETTMFVVIQRPDYEGIHSGQVSLPGGRRENSDKSPEQTALRETYEEIGVEQANIKVIGKLTDLYIPPSNFLVHPYVGYIEPKPVFVPHPLEVSKIIEIPLAELLNEENRTKKKIHARGIDIMAPCYVIKDVTIWGATAMILSEFREVVRRALRQE